MPPKLTPILINAAIAGFEVQKQQIDSQIAELRAMLPAGRTNSEPDAISEAAPGKRKKFSAASRRKMSIAQKKRWTKLKSESVSPQPAPAQKAAKRKRRMSAEGRLAIAEATRKRWEAFRAAKTQQERAAKKTGRKKGPVARRKSAAKKTVAAPATETA